MVVRPRVRSSAVVVLWTAVNISGAGAGAGASVPGGLVRLQQDCCCFYFCSFTYSEGTLTKQPSSTHDSHHRSTVFIIKHYFLFFFSVLFFLQAHVFWCRAVRACRHPVSHLAVLTRPLRETDVFSGALLVFHN